MIHLVSTSNRLLLRRNAEVFRQIFLFKICFQMLLYLVISVTRRKRSIILRTPASWKKNVMLHIRLSLSLISYIFSWVNLERWNKFWLHHGLEHGWVNSKKIWCLGEITRNSFCHSSYSNLFGVAREVFQLGKLIFRVDEAGCNSLSFLVLVGK